MANFNGKEMARYLTDDEMARWQDGKKIEILIGKVLEVAGKMKSKDEIILFLVSFLEANSRELDEIENEAKARQDYDDRIAHEAYEKFMASGKSYQDWFEWLVEQEVEL